MWVDELLSREPIRRDGNNLIYEANAGADWARRQMQSVGRYVDASYEEDPTQGQMFGNFIATSLKSRNSVVVDVGCGLSPDLPHYVAQLSLKRFVGLEPLTTEIERTYPCLVGAVAENIPLKDSSVDAAVFATSFDHIGDASAAIDEIRRVLKKGGMLFMWQGVSGPEELANSSTLHRLKAGTIAIPLILAQAAKVAYRMRKRRRQLATGERLDDAHERWFTRKSLFEAIHGWGFELTRILEPPGMPSVFIEARPQTAG